MSNMDINKEMMEKIERRVEKIAERVNEAFGQYHTVQNFKIVGILLNTGENNVYEIKQILNGINFVEELYLFKEDLFKVFFELEKAEWKHSDFLNKKYTFLRGHNPREEEYNLFTGSFEEQEEIKWKRHLPLETVEKIKEEDKKIDLKDLEKEVWRKVDGFFEN